MIKFLFVFCIACFLAGCVTPPAQVTVGTRTTVDPIGVKTSEWQRISTPTYPREAALAGVEGHVVARVLLDESGSVKQALILERHFAVSGVADANGGIKSIAELFDAPTIDFLMKSRFTPTTRDGKPVTVWGEIRVEYRMPR